MNKSMAKGRNGFLKDGTNLDNLFAMIRAETTHQDYVRRDANPNALEFRIDQISLCICKVSRSLDMEKPSRLRSLHASCHTAI